MASKSRSSCSFPSQRSVLGLKNIFPTTTKSTRQSTRCQVPVRVKKGHKPLGDLVPFIFRIRFGRLGGGGLRSLFRFGAGFLAGSGAEPAATGGGCSVMNGFLSLSLFRFFGTSGSRNLARSIVPFAGALALGPTFALMIRVPVPTGVALPFPLSSNRFTVPPSWTPLPGRGTASPESGRHSGHQRHPTRSRRPRSHWVRVGGVSV